MLSVPAEASAFLGFVGVCMAFLVVFYLYLSKKLCFTSIGNFPCCDQPLQVDKSKIARDLGSSFAYDDEDESSTDSEDEVLERLHRSASSHYNLKKQSSLLPIRDGEEGAERERGAQGEGLESGASGGLEMKDSTSSDRLISRSPTSLSKDGTTPSAITRSTTASTMTTVVRADGADFRRRGSRTSSRGTPTDLISLAEKGRVGRSESSGGSCASESGSADTEEEAMAPFLREKAKRKARETRSLLGPLAEIRPQAASLPKTGNKLTSSTSKTSLKQASHYQNSGFERSESLDGAHSSQSCQEFQTPSSSKQEEERELRQGGQNQSGIRCGSLEVSHAYDAPSKKLIITVIQAQDLPSKDRGGAQQVYVRMVMLPNKRQKSKTKARPCGTGSPQFDETFTFNRISPEDVLGLGFRFRLYSSERMRREHLIGECVMAFACSKPLQHETRLKMLLEPRSNLSRTDSRSDVSSLARSDSTGSTQSMQNATSPELLMGLAYNGTTGRLQVSVIKGSQFKNATMSRAPDTYIKLSLVSSTGQEIARSKTSVRRGQPNPLFKETFVFQVALFQLPDVTLMVSVYNKRSMKRKEMIGWYSLGLNSSGEEEMSHWNDMRDNKGEQVCRWHVLLDS